MPRPSLDAIGCEITVIDGQLHCLNERHVDFTRLIEDMECLRASLLVEKEDLEKRRAELEDAKAPIHWLPVELLLAIFERVCEDADAWGGRSLHVQPVFITHVCHKWRLAALDAPVLWSRIVLSGTRPHTEWLATFLDRSRKHPLDWHCSSMGAPPETSIEESCVSTVLDDLREERCRVRSLTFDCHSPETMALVVDTLNTASFVSLSSLDLAITQADPSFQSVRRLAERNSYSNIEKNMAAAAKLAVPAALCTLIHLRLERVPLLNFPPSFYPALRSLELCFPSAVNGIHRPSQYELRMSALVRFLSLMPQLEQLTLLDTVPKFDIAFKLDVDAGHVVLPPGVVVIPTSPVDLPNLKILEWSFPDSHSIPGLLVYLRAPSLERLIISLHPEDVRLLNNRHTVPAYSDASTSEKARIIWLSGLKELGIAFPDTDSLSATFRRAEFAVLERLTIGASSPSSRKQPLPSLPRLETVFRDPRFPHLTDLTLAYVTLLADHAQGTLGYTTALRDLTFLGCMGVGPWLTLLHKPVPACGVRYCPLLRSMTFDECDDLEPAAIMCILKVRNGDEEPGDLGGRVQEKRNIKPLRRGRHAGTHSGRHGSMPTEQAMRPMRIELVHIYGCPRVGEDSVNLMRRNAVEETVWHP